MLVTGSINLRPPRPKRPQAAPPSVYPPDLQRPAFLMLMLVQTICGDLHRHTPSDGDRIARALPH